MRRPSPTAVLPITEDDAFLAEVLESASIPALQMAMIHLTGDSSLLDADIRPGGAALGEPGGGISDAQKEEVRAAALEVLRAHRDGDGASPPPPDAEMVRRMMSFAVGQPVADAYVPMMLEELALDGRDARDVRWDGVAEEARAAFPVLVIGAGMSGLLAAVRLEDAGLPCVVVEKNAGVGGTWFENTYPGCRVDVGNHFYSYSFAPNHGWSEFFSRQPELVRYFDRFADEFGIRQRIRFETEVVSAQWDEDEASWSVRFRTRSGAEGTERFRAIISAVGQLNRPKIPALGGLERFTGPAFHSAQWRHDVDLAGRDVAVVGTGASAFQLVPEAAKEARHLTVYQRSPGWMLPNPVYHERVSAGKKWLLEHVPYYGRWYRFLIFFPGSDGLMPSLVKDPSWPHPERAVNATNDFARKTLIQYMAAQIGDDEELLEKVTPTYPPFVKRILQDNGTWLATLKRENVTLETSAIREVTENAIVTADGASHHADAIVFATGFHANRFLWPMEIRGRDGVVLSEVWGEEPRAYLGITVPRFPNLFCLYGPATNLAHAGSIIFHSECQVRYVMGCLRALVAGGHRSMDCRQEVHDVFNRQLDARHETLVWSHPGATSWYRNSRGRVTTTSPWLLVDYWGWTREPDLADYEIR